MIKWQYDVNESLIAKTYDDQYEELESTHGGDKIKVDLVDLYKIPAK